MKRLLIATAAAVSVSFAGLAVAAQGHGPATQTVTPPPSKLTICHKTGSETNPWRRITVSSRAMNAKSQSGRILRAHLRHTGDAVVVGAAACPSANVTPAPTKTPAMKMTICHKTGSATNPYRRITISSRAVTNPNSPAGKTMRGHMGHTGDMLMPGVTACPSGTPANEAKLTAKLQAVHGVTGSGTASVTIRMGSSELCYTLTVTGLTDVTAAHIHRGSTGDVVVPLTAPTSGTSSGCTTVAKALLQEILRSPGEFYVNVHTLAKPGGHVQGTLSR